MQMSASALNRAKYIVIFKKTHLYWGKCILQLVQYLAGN